MPWRILADAVMGLHLVVMTFFAMSVSISMAAAGSGERFLGVVNFYTCPLSFEGEEYHWKDLRFYSINSLMPYPYWRSIRATRKTNNSE